MQLGIAILLPDDVHNAMRRWQLVVADLCGANAALKVRPHITLKQPFHARALGPIEDYFDRLVEQVEPVEILLDGVGRFEDDEVVFLAVTPERRLEALRLRVLADLREQFGVKPRDIEDERYRFHATVAYGLPDGTFERAWGALNGIEVSFSFRLGSLGLFHYTGQEWVLYKKARLGQTSRASGAVPKPEQEDFRHVR